MQVITSKELNNNIEKYLDIAEQEQVLIQRGRNEIFVLEKTAFLEPDDDFRRAIDVEEFRSEVHKHIDCLYSKEK